MDDLLHLKNFFDKVTHAIVFIDTDSNEIVHFVAFEEEPNENDIEEAEDEAINDLEAELPENYEIRLATATEIERFKALVMDKAKKDLN